MISFKSCLELEGGGERHAALGSTSGAGGESGSFRLRGVAIPGPDGDPFRRSCVDALRSPRKRRSRMARLAPSAGKLGSGGSASISFALCPRIAAFPFIGVAGGREASSSSI